MRNLSIVPDLEPLIVIGINNMDDFYPNTYKGSHQYERVSFHSMNHITVARMLEAAYMQSSLIQSDLLGEAPYEHTQKRIPLKVRWKDSNIKI